MTGTIVATLLVIGSIGLSAQQNPGSDFSGTWVRVRTSPAATPDKPLVIKQTPQELIIHGDGWRNKLVYALDGSETKVLPSDNQNVVAKAKAHWKGRDLLVETVRTITRDSGTVIYHFTDTFRLKTPDELVFERLTKAARGEQLVTVVYRRAP